MLTVVFVAGLTFAIQGALICPPGKFFYDGVCELCPLNCSLCYSASVCSECKAGYYGESCSMVCRANCRDSACDKSTGVCISCLDGYFKDANKSCLSCPSNCLLCSSDTFCSMCKIGCAGRLCQEECINCKPGTACDQLTGECYECKQGLTGVACGEKCDSKCSLCRRFQGEKCVACSDEKYGSTCEKDCSLHCVNKACNDSDGVCTQGCQDGYWGSLCDVKCMAGCNNSICDRQNGSCLQDYTGSNIGTEGNCPDGCSCDAEGTCRDLNTQPPKWTEGVTVLYLALSTTTVIFIVLVIIGCILAIRRRAKVRRVSNSVSLIPESKDDGNRTGNSKLGFRRLSCISFLCFIVMKKVVTIS